MIERNFGVTPLIKLIVPGKAMILKNHKRIFGRGRRKIVLPSERYLAWEKEAMLHVARQMTVSGINHPVFVDYKFYLKNFQGEPDASNLVEGIQDVLQKAGVLVNDKLVRKFTAEKIFGEGDARTELEIFKYERAK